ncbi:hypothetical protein NDU88_005565, partial [Pleurodeles waltl]
FQSVLGCGPFPGPPRDFPCNMPGRGSGLGQDSIKESQPNSQCSLFRGPGAEQQLLPELLSRRPIWIFQSSALHPSLVIIVPG